MINNTGYSLVNVVVSAGPSGKDPILLGEGLVSWLTLFKEVGFSGLLPLAETFLREDCIKLGLGLGCNIMVQVFVLIGNVFLQRYFSQVDLLLE